MITALLTLAVLCFATGLWCGYARQRYDWACRCFAIGAAFATASVLA